MVYGDGYLPEGSCQPLLLARCRLQHLAGSHVTRCQFMCHLLPARVSPAAGSATRCWLHHPLPSRAPTSHPAGTAVTSQGSFSRFLFSYSKRNHVGIDCKPVPTQAKSQSWDGDEAPGTARLPGTTKTSSSGVQAAGFRALREGQED